MLFSYLDEAWFLNCVTDYFLRVSYTSDAYEQCVLTSKKTFKINQSIIRQLQVARWQEKDIFVDFNNL